MKKIFATILGLFLIIAPVVSLQAQQLNLIICDPGKIDDAGKVTNDCTFAHLVQLAQNVINALIIFSTFLAVAAFSYAGFLLLTSGGDEGAMKKAKGIFSNVLTGYVWILVAWLLIYTITRALLNDGFDFLGAPNS